MSDFFSEHSVYNTVKCECVPAFRLYICEFVLVGAEHIADDVAVCIHLFISLFIYRILRT